MAAISEIKSNKPKYIFDKDKVDKIATLFLVGTAAETIYGCQPVMALRCTIMQSFSTQDIIDATSGEAALALLATDTGFGKTSPVNLPFHFVWSWINGTMFSVNHYPDISISDILKMWEYADIFGITAESFFNLLCSVMKAVIDRCPFSNDDHLPITQLIDRLETIEVKYSKMNIVNTSNRLIRLITDRFNVEYANYVYGERDTKVPSTLKEIPPWEVVPGDTVQIIESKDCVVAICNDVSNKDIDSRQPWVAGLYTSKEKRKLKHTLAATINGRLWYRSADHQYWILPVVDSMKVHLRFFGRGGTQTYVRKDHIIEKKADVLHIPPESFLFVASSLKGYMLDVSGLRASGKGAKTMPIDHLPGIYKAGSHVLNMYAVGFRSIIKAIVLSGNHHRLAEFKDEIFATTNKLRAHHGIRPLTNTQMVRALTEYQTHHEEADAA